MGPTKHCPNAVLCKALFEIVSLVSFVSNRFFKMIGEMEVALLKMSDFFWVLFSGMKDDNRVCLAGGIIQKAYIM